jgi:7-keto-8-aminopelargonate synthetase-like enzyme
VIEEVDGLYVKVRGYPRKALNLAVFDFLGMSLEKELKTAAEQTLEKVREFSSSYT